MEVELKQYLEEKFEAVDRRFEQVDRRFEAVLREMTGEFAAVRQEAAAAHAETRAYVDTRLDAGVAELRHQFEVTAEALRDDIQAIAENVAQVEQKLERETADIRNEMREGFAETHALINSTYPALDRRVTALEQR